MRLRAVRSSRRPRDIVPEDYRANANGDDNATKLLDAFEAAAYEGMALDFRHRLYVCRSQLLIPANVRNRARNGTIQVNPDTPVSQSGGTNLITQSNTPWPSWDGSTLAQDALRGSREIRLNNIGELRVGDRFVIWSNHEMTGYVAPYSRASDHGRIRSIAGTTITLFNALRMDFKVSDGAAVRRVLQTGGVEFENMTFIGSGALKFERAFASEFAYGNRYFNCTFLDMDRSALGEGMCMGTVARGHYYESTLAAESGYGISIGSCFGCNYGDVRTRRARHAATLAAPASAYNRLSGRDIVIGDIESLEATGSAMDQHPGAPFVMVGNVKCVMHNDADRSSPVVTAQGGGMTLGDVYGENASAGGIGFQCLGWYEYEGCVPTVKALSIDGGGTSGMLTIQNRTNKSGLAGGQKIAMVVGKVGGEWDRGIRMQSYDGSTELMIGPGGKYTCFTQAVYLQSSAAGRPVLNLSDVEFEMTNETTTPIILQGKAWADAHPGELGGEINWRRGSFASPRKEIANSYGVIRLDDFAEPPNTSIFQEGGQKVSPIYRWISNGMLDVFTVGQEGLDLEGASARLSFSGFPVTAKPVPGHKRVAGTAQPDGTLINTETTTFNEAGFRAALRYLKAVGDALHNESGHGLTRYALILPPELVSNPAVTGIPAVGEVLTATHAVFTNNPTGYIGNWYRDGAAIPGATALTYTQVSGDNTKKVTYREYATNDGGQSLTQGISNEIATGRPYFISPPQISYVDLNVGSTLTCSDGVIGNSPTSITYQWFQGLIPIEDATTNQHVVAVDDDGNRLRCEATPANANGAVTETSNSVGPIEVGWTIRNMPGLNNGEWWYASYLLNGSVASWSGATRSLKMDQATSGSRPTKSATSFNGHAGVASTGGKYLESNPIGVPAGFPVGADPGWILVAAKRTSNSGNLLGYGFNTANTGRYVAQRDLQVDGTYLLQGSSLNTAPLPQTFATLAGNPLPDYLMVFVQFRDANTIDLWVNGSFIQTVTTTANFNTGTARFRFFAGAGGTLGTPWVGELAHVAIGSGVPEVSDIQRAMGFLAWTLDLQSYLPDDHPYRNTPPY